jgi:hypothetical protein
MAAIAPHAVVSAKWLRRSTASAVLLTFATFLLVVTMPRLVWTEMQRFFDPYGDHPPYSRLVFDVTPGDVEVLYADGVDIHAVVRGPNPERVELVVERGTSRGSSAGSAAVERQILPMFPEPDNGWRTSLAQVVEPAEYFVRSGSARSRRYHIDVILVPEIVDVQFRITPPAYTRRAPYEGSLPHDGLSGLMGTVVEVRARSNRPLGGGTIQVIGESGTSTVSLTPSADDPQVATGSFPITQHGRMELHVFDPEQRRSRVPFHAPITLLEDQSPFVRLLEPREISFATPDAVLPVVLAAEDDYGLSAVELYRNLNNSAYRPQPIEVADPPPTRANDVVLLPLRDYRLEPGDEIRVFARVTDNDPHPLAVDGGDAGEPQIGKGAESAVALVRIISREEFDRLQQSRESLESLLSKYQQAQRRVESLQEELETLQKQVAADPADSPLSEERQQDLERLTKRMQEEAEALQKLAESALPFDLDKQLTPELERLQKLVKDAAESLSKRPQNASASQTGELLEQLQQQLAEGSKQFQDATEPPLELLSQVFPLMENSARFVQLYERQRDLAERLKSLRALDNPDSPAARARMRELEAEQRVLREELADLTQEIRENAEQLPDDERLNELRETALKFAEDLRKCGAAGKMGEAEQGLSEFSGSTGHAAAEEAANILEQFLSRCSGMGGQCKSCLPKFQPGLSNSLSQTMDQLLQQMGLGMGMGDGGNPGLGTGFGNGYSARRSSAQNVGLYGSQPMVDAASSRASGQPSNRQSGTRGRGAGGDDNRDPRDGGLSFRRKLTAGGSGDFTVPPRYRDRVSRYFQRLADELGDR